MAANMMELAPARLLRNPLRRITWTHDLNKGVSHRLAHVRVVARDDHVGLLAELLDSFVDVGRFLHAVFHVLVSAGFERRVSGGEGRRESEEGGCCELHGSGMSDLASFLVILGVWMMSTEAETRILCATCIMQSTLLLLTSLPTKR